MPNIGGVNVLFGASAAGFNSVVDETKRRLTNLAVHAKSTSILPAIGSGAGMAFKGLAVGAGAAVIGVKSAFKGMGSMVSLLSDPLRPVENLFKSFTNPVLDANGEFQKIAQIARDSDRLGISTESLITLQHAFGGTADMLVPSLVKMSRAISGTESAAEAAGKPLNHFGVDINALGKMQPDAVLKTLADRYEQLVPGIDRAAFATAFFGKSGMELDTGLRKIAGGGLAEVRKRAEELKLTFSRGEAFGVMEAVKSAKEMSLMFEGVRRQATIAVAPLVASIGTSINEWLKTVDLKSVFVEAVDFLLGAFDAIHGIFEDIATIAKDMKGVFKTIGEGIDNLSFVFEGHRELGSLASLGPGGEPRDTSYEPEKRGHLRELADRIRGRGLTGMDFSEDPKKEALDLAARGATDAANMATLALLKHHAEVASLTVDSRKMWEAQTSGASWSAVEMLKIREETKSFAGDLEALRQKGATEKDIIPVLKEQARIRTEMLSQRSLKEGASIFESVKLPTEIYASELSRLKDLLTTGVLSWETYARAIDKAGMSLDQASNARNAFTAGEALTRGSAGAIAAVNREKFAGDSPQKRTEDLLKEMRDYLMQQLQEAKALGAAGAEQAKLLEKILNPPNAMKP